MTQAGENVARYAPVAEPDGEGALSGVIRRLSTAGSLDEVMAAVNFGVRVVLRADGATFVLRDGDRCYYADEDAVSPLWKGRRFPMSACVSGWCMSHRQSLAIADIYQDPRIPIDAYRPTFVRSLAMAPVGRAESVAALGAYWSERRQVQPAELERLQALADAASVALARLSPSKTGASRQRRPDATAPARKTREPEAQGAPGRGAVRAFLTRIRNNGLRPNSFEAYGFAILCVLAATLVREAFKATGAQGLATFSTYYPAVLMAMVAGGRRSGVIAAALGGLAAYYFFMPPLYDFVQPNVSDALNLALYASSSALIILIVDWYKRALLRLRQEDARHLTLAREQSHRLKNAIAVVEAVVQQGLRDQPERARTIARRIRGGLAQIDLHDDDLSQPADLRSLLTAELEPFDIARFTLAGDDAPQLPPKSRSILSLVVHELATNALKYGALSAPEGHVTVAWACRDGQAKIVWSEAGGPAVQPPKRRGYGSVLSQRLMQAVGGAFKIEFRPAGVTADISLAVP